MGNKQERTAQPCDNHDVIDCSVCLKNCIEELLYWTYTRGNGGFNSDYGIVLFTKMVKLTGYDLSKRHILITKHESIIKNIKHD